MTSLIATLEAELPQLRQQVNKHKPFGELISGHSNRNDIFIVWSQPSGEHRICDDCLFRKWEILYDNTSQALPEMTIELARSVVLESAGRGLGMAVTNANVGQNWSLLAPWPQCPKCHQSLEHLTAPTPDRHVSGADGPALNSYSGNGVQRRISSQDFAKAHRGLFGFGSVLLNPTQGSEAGVFTVDTGMFLGSPTTFAPVGGKGLSLPQALASCIGEGVERYYLAAKTPTGSARRVTLRNYSSAPWYSAIDFDGAPIDLAPESLIEVRETCLLDTTGNETVMVPESLIRAPYIPDATLGVASGTPSSTTGAAAGGTISEASLQAVFELLERDAFWFASRTALPLWPIDDKYVDPIRASIETQLGVTATLRWMKHPTQVPIAHCVLSAKDATVTMCSRGMGVAADPRDAVSKAMVEAVQMWRSIATGVEVEPCSTDMRHLWWTGEARNEFPGLFGYSSRPNETTEPFKAFSSDAVDATTILSEVVVRGQHSGISFLRFILADSTSHSVVRCISPEILPLDETYFPQSQRFAAWRDFLDWNKPVVYSGPLFM